MTLKQIKYLETVCKTGSVTRAAEELYVSRPVISRALKELEKEFGVELFVRSRLGLEPTECGKLLQNLLYEFSGAYATMQLRIKQLEEQDTRRSLNIGITATCGKRFYPKLYNEFHEKYPDIQLKVVEMSSYEAWDSIITGTTDFFFLPMELPGDVSTSIMGELPLYSSQMVFCAAKSSQFIYRNSVTPHDILNCPIAALYTRLPIEWPLKVVLRTSQQAIIRETIAGGAAFGILPLDMIENWDGVIGIPFMPPLPFTTRLIWNKAIPHSSAFDDLLSFIQNYDLTKL